MKKTKYPPATLAEWVEFCWLVVSDPTFVAEKDWRKAYFDYRLAKIYTSPCC